MACPRRSLVFLTPLAFSLSACGGDGATASTSFGETFATDVTTASGTATGTGGTGSMGTDSVGTGSANGGSSGVVDSSTGGATSGTGGTSMTSGTDGGSTSGATADTTGGSTGGTTGGLSATSGGSTGGGSTSGTTGGGLLCQPGVDTQCNGNMDVEICNANGDGWDPHYTCDGFLGLSCDAQFGDCTGPCHPGNLGTSYIGCEYYPTVTSNSVDTSYNFAVAVANTSGNAATVTVHQGANQITQVVVAANSLQIIDLPWVQELKGGELLNTQWPTVLAMDGAYRLRSTQPVTVYQYNPIEYKLGGTCTVNFPQDCSFTNDASLLMPTNTWGDEYVVAARNGLGDQIPGFYAVVAMEDATTVTLSPSATGGSVAAGAGVAANGVGNVMLDQGDVLEVYSTFEESVDLTGTFVDADKPVQVIGGHRCIYIPNDTPYCDHIEETMLPITALASDYIVSAPLIKINNADSVSPNMVRVIATEDNTTISYDPPQAGAPTGLTNAGDFFEIAATPNSFEISADKKIEVVQYMRGHEATNSAVGDPAMALAVPTEQFRTSYLFHAPTTYEYNYVNVVAPTGASVTLDGAPVVGWTAIGNTGHSLARLELPNNGNGNHNISSTEQFGITVYGYGVDTSYWYPGGLDLTLIPQ